MDDLDIHYDHRSMVVSHTNYADKMRANDCGRQCCRPCTGKQNQGWWSRMLSVWFYVAIGSLSYISFERPSELAHNYDLLLEVDQWKILEAKVTALQAAGALSDTDVGRLMATKPTPGDQTNNWNASEYRGTPGNVDLPPRASQFSAPPVFI